MSASALLCFAPGVEEMEAITIFDLLVRGGIDVTTARVASDTKTIITCSRGIKIVINTLFESVDKDNHDIIILPGGMRSSEHFRDDKLLIETIRQFHLSGRIVAAICAAVSMVLVYHNIFPNGKMTGFPELKSFIPATQWKNKRVVWDQNVKLLTSQGPGTAIDFALKIIDLLVGREKVHEVASSLILTKEILDYF